MKTGKAIVLSIVLGAMALGAQAQEKTEKLKVSGECNTCKKKIESAAKNAGATYAVWDKTTKELVIRYNTSASNTAKIEQSIAHAGYDTPDYKASEDAYNQLDDCCKYDRTGAKESSKKKN